MSAFKLLLGCGILAVVSAADTVKVKMCGGGGSLDLELNVCKSGDDANLMVTGTKDEPVLGVYPDSACSQNPQASLKLSCDCQELVQGVEVAMVCGDNNDNTVEVKPCGSEVPSEAKKSTGLELNFCMTTDPGTFMITGTKDDPVVGVYGDPQCTGEPSKTFKLTCSCNEIAKGYGVQLGSGCSSGLSGGAIAGIVIGVLVAVAAIGAGVFFVMKKKGGSYTNA